MILYHNAPPENNEVGLASLSGEATGLDPNAAQQTHRYSW